MTDKNNMDSRKGMTLLEIVIAMAIMSIIFAAVIPQFTMVQKSWSFRRADSEALQNGRVLMDHMHRNLAAAVRIVDVSDPTETNGYIEFEDNNGDILRYDVAGGYVQFGSLGDTAYLASMINRLQFTCYSLNDLDTPTTNADSIRFIRAEADLGNAILAQDRTFVISAYLTTNGTLADNTIVVQGSNFVFGMGYGGNPAVAQINDSHFLCAYTGAGADGWAVVLTTDVDAAMITQEVPFEFDTQTGRFPALAKIDYNHYLCAYTGGSSRGYAVVLNVDTNTWKITKNTTFQFDSNGNAPALVRIDATHYLCAYAASSGVATVMILTVNTGTWDITPETPFQYESGPGLTPALARIDATHYLCVYKGAGQTGRAVVLIPDTVSGKVTKGSNYIFDLDGGGWPGLARIKGPHYLCAYTTTANTGHARILTIDTTTWGIDNNGDSFEFGPGQGKWPAVAGINDTEVLLLWDGVGDVGTATILTTDTASGKVEKGRDFIFDLKGMSPALSRITGTNYIGIYQGKGGVGWSVLFNTDPPVKP